MLHTLPKKIPGEPYVYYVDTITKSDYERVESHLVQP